MRNSIHSSLPSMQRAPTWSLILLTRWKLERLNIWCYLFTWWCLPLQWKTMLFWSRSPAKFQNHKNLKSLQHGVCCVSGQGISKVQTGFCEIVLRIQVIYSLRQWMSSTLRWRARGLIWRPCSRRNRLWRSWTMSGRTTSTGWRPCTKLRSAIAAALDFFCCENCLLQMMTLS